MAPRVELQSLLAGIAGVKKAYFQPPSTIALEYPCIIYNLSKIDAKFADNAPYTHARRYDVTVIDRDPDSKIPDQIAMLPMSTFDRTFRSDNLNHSVFTLYF